MLGSVAMVIGDRDARLVVQTALECAGYECAAFSSTPGLLRGLKREDTRLVVIDIDESLVDWRVVIDWRRNWLNPSVGLIAVGAANGASTAAALNGGVDDYVSRPIHGPELLARISAVTRRSGAVAVPAFALAGCEIDRTAGALRSERATVALTSREMGIAQLLFEQVGHVVSRQRLASEVWASSPELIGHSIEQHIYQLRRKLERCVGKRLVLRSVYGHGYRLEMIGAAAPCKPCLHSASKSHAAVMADAA